MTKIRKKLIEVALPLDAINVAAAREKSIRHGHPSTLHLWWARRPLAAARAVIFAQMVDDPSSWPDLFPTEKKQEKERLRLFKIIEDLVQWENTTNEEVLQRARDAIWESWRRTCAENADHIQADEIFNRTVLPGFHDPFAGGGAIPLEAQRLGLASNASDLNPVAVLINKATVEIPSRFASRPPVNPDTKNKMDLVGRVWEGTQGLVEDIRYYGQWLQDQAEKKIGRFYPPVQITPEMTEERPDLKPHEGGSLPVVAWLWARTVRSPDPGFGAVEVPLVSTFMLCTKPGKEAYIEPVVQGKEYRFVVRIGKPKNPDLVKQGTKLARGANFKCLLSGAPINGDYIKSEAQAGRLGEKLIAIVVQGSRGRLYVAPDTTHERVCESISNSWVPDTPLNGKARDQLPLYGIDTYSKLFTKRQTLVLSTLSDLVTNVISEVTKDALNAGFTDDDIPIHRNGSEALAYAEAIGIYLSFACNKVADRGSTLSRWDPTPTQSGVINTFSRQALPMTWDFAETNPLGDASGNFMGAIDLVAKALLAFPAGKGGYAVQADASTQSLTTNKVVSTDPPYYDNICYADLSDFFYVWLRRTLRQTLPELFATVAVPKSEELIASPYRHNSKSDAEKFFVTGMTRAMNRLAAQAHPAFPLTIYYAFKQSENSVGDGTTNTGWDTFLAAVIDSGLAITGTWPIRTELSNRMISSGANALASSIILVCRPRAISAPTATRREFLNALKNELPPALTHLQAGNIAPVDLAQAAIGPGMAVYSRFARVLDAEGKPLSVRAALALINQTLDESLAEQEGEFDADTRWALLWFDQMGFDEGDFGAADILARAKGTAVDGLAEAGIVTTGRGKVRLLAPTELDNSWDPETDQRLTVWETVHRLIQAQATGGETAAAAIVAKLGSKSETSRELCYRLYSLCERKRRAQDAMPYNALVQSWPEIVRLAQQQPNSNHSHSGDLFSQE
jgi:putative DNA methylase